MTRDDIERDLLELIPELTQFRDMDLQRRVVDTWVDACDVAGKSPREIAEMPFSLLVADCPVSFIEHTRGVTQVALAIAETLKKAYPDKSQMHADYDVLLAGALLHDVGKVLEIGRVEDADGWAKTESGKMLRHPISGTALAYVRGLPDKVLHCIACHSKEGDGYRKTVEAHIIHHADFVNFEPLH
jgi:putative nucleotidyltransferase with HDIG domain